MVKEQVINPFFIGKYIGDHYFCDREKDTQALVKHIINGRNIALISPRRLGKSGLIHHTFNRPEIKDSYITIYVDIYSTQNLAEFAKALSEAIIRTIKIEKSWPEKFLTFMKSLKLGFKIDSISGEPAIDICVGDIEFPEKTVRELFEYLKTLPRPCVLAIDEFQQIREYPEKGIEAYIRTIVQGCPHTSFIFCGSKRHIMTDMFFSPSKPFFQSVISQSLHPIPMDVYIDFAGRLFAERGKFLDKFAAEVVYKKFDGCTWYIQMMMNEMFALTEKGSVCTTEYIDFAWDNIIMSQEDRYQSILYHLAPKQKQILYAIAKDGKAANITSSDFIKRHRLVSASSVQAAMKPLLKHDIVTCEEGTFRIYDYFFAAYLAGK